MPKLKKIILAIVIGLTLVNPVLVLAQTTNTNSGTTVVGGKIEVPTYTGVQGSIEDFLCTPSDAADGHALENCINKLYRFSISFGAIALVFFLVLAGYFYITGGMSGKSRAKGMLRNAFVGMAILLGSYVILRFINPNLVILKPIQPPIFQAEDLPSCAEVGFGERCVIASTGGISTGGGKCSIPISATSENGVYNNTIHGVTGSGHGPVRTAPNGAPPLGTVDVGVKGGSPVYAAISGKVVKYGDLGTFGKYVSIISDPQGGEFGCEKSDACANQAHIEPTVKVGDMVTAGQQIGTMTNYTGGMGPHLHIELKLNGQWITGDGRKGTWDNMKSACAASGAAGSTSGSAPSGTIDAKTVIPKLVVDMQYASANPSSHNFMSTALYTGTNAKYGSSCFLDSQMASKVKAANTALQQSKPGWKIKAWDCYRPMDVQQRMYDWSVANGKTGLVAKPNANAQHPRGLAIDATLVDASGKDVEMPTHFDYYVQGGKQDPGTAAYNATPQSARTNAALLNTIMTGAGLIRAGNEWWHFGM